MAALTINGITIPVAADSAARTDIEIGEGLSRAFDGSLLRTSRGYKRQWQMATTPDLQANTQAFVKLLQGQGDHWSFDSGFYSDKGQSYSALTNTTQSASGGRYGGKLTLGSSTGSITFANVFSTNGGTVLISRFETGVWVDYQLTLSTSGAAVALYRNGIAQSVAIPSWLTVSWVSKNLTITNTGGTAQDYDELQVWPFTAPTAWLASLNTFRASQAMPQSPRLTMGGDIGSATVDGRPGQSKIMMGALSGTFYDNLESVQFELWEA